MGATLKDIARLAGCSHTLVSGVLQGNPSCRASREMRKKILKLSCELDYRPNRLARRLRGIRSKVVFVLSRFRPAPEHSLMISAIQEETVRRLYSVRVRSGEEVKRERVASGITEGGGSSDGSVRRKAPTKVVKVGRNDPCPCGSGQKWKKCTCKEYHS